jgi:hypothetical protein
MGWSTGDLDGNGRLDHVVTSFETDSTAVFLCGDDAFCEDMSSTVGTTILRSTFRWGVGLVDLDLDGDLDIVEATGHYHDDAEVRAIGYLSMREQPANLMVNLGDGRIRIPPLAPEDALLVPRAMRGLAITDLDDDGQPDVVMAPALGAAALLRAVVPRRGHFLAVHLVGRAPNTDAAGARVWVRADARVWQRERSLGEGFLGNFDPRLFFGVDHPGPVDVEVRWPSGVRSRLTRVAVDGTVEMREP